jgi:hypothetical protein
MDVDRPREHEEAARIDDVGGRRPNPGADLGDGAVPNQDIGTL